MMMRVMRLRVGPRWRGFTLMEVLLAIGLMVLLLAFTGSFAIDLGRQRTRLAGVSHELSGWVMVVDRLDRALTCVIAGDPSAGSGVVGGPGRLVLLTRGVWLDAGLVAGDEGEAGPEDLQRVSLLFDESRGEVVLESSAVGGGGEGTGSGRGVVISGVAYARLRYYTGLGWVESFDTSSAGVLPMAVELAVWLGEVEREEGAVSGDDEDGFGLGLEADDGGGVLLGGGGGRSLLSEPRGEPDFVRVFSVPDSREPKAADEVGLADGGGR